MTTKNDDPTVHSLRESMIVDSDPTRARMLLAVIFVCVAEIVAGAVPILGSVVSRVTIAIASSCLGWLIGWPIDAASVRRESCANCARCRSEITPDEMANLISRVRAASSSSTRCAGCACACGSRIDSRISPDEMKNLISRVRAASTSKGSEDHADGE